MKAKSIKGFSTRETINALNESMEDGFSPTLAICMVSVKQDIEQLRNTLKEKGIQIFGVTTHGEFIDGDLETGSSAILLLDMKEENFRITNKEFEEREYRQTGKDIASEALEFFPNPSFLIGGSSMDTDAEEILNGIKDILGKEVNVFGGMGGDDFSFSLQYAFTNDIQLSRGMVALVFNGDNVELSGRATCGWKAQGTEKVVTHSEGNHIYTIDNTPALDINAKYGGIIIDKDDDDLVNKIASMCTIQLINEDGEVLMRPGLVIDWDDHSLYSSGSVPQGSTVKFSLPPEFDAIEEVIDGCKYLKETSMPEADAVVYFSCAGRFVSFGPVMSEEIEGVKEVWGVPLVGMFSNAEFGKTKNGTLQLHNLTSCVVALKEK